jgi:hypothetical protein
MRGYELGYFLFDVRSVESVVRQVISARIAFGTLEKLKGLHHDFHWKIKKDYSQKY